MQPGKLIWYFCGTSLSLVEESDTYMLLDLV